MPRPREFDETEVLRRALGVFTAKGFETATLDELEAATGLRRASLYGAFGDKRALFHKALGFYLDTALNERLATLESPAAGRAAILAVFRDLARTALADRERRGCLMTNCAIELAPTDPEVACMVGRKLDRIERAFVQAVRQAQARGELPPERDAARLGRFLAVCMEGLLVLARARPDPAWIEDTVAAIDDALR